MLPVWSDKVMGQVVLQRKVGQLFSVRKVGHVGQLYLQVTVSNLAENVIERRG
jgi:hypothetical protein